MSDFEDRHDGGDPAELIADPDEKARRETENGIRQFKAALAVIRRHTAGSDDPFRFTEALILDLHRVGLDGIHAQAGAYRDKPVTIGESRHVPPRHAEVPDLVVRMCDWVEERWHGFDAAELAAYVLWRINWIHPFADGNGRTARTVAYVVLSIKLGYVLPGSPTIPEQIDADKAPYYRFLQEADNSWRRDIVAVSGMEAMLETMLERQLKSAAPAEPG